MFQSIPKRKCTPAGPRWKRFNGSHRILISQTYILAVFLAGMVGVCFISPDQVSAQIRELKADQILEGDIQQPWEIEADEIAYDRELDQYTARGNVKISKNDIQLTADFIEFDHKTMHADAQGNVVLTVGQDILSGSHMDMDLDRQVGSIENAYLFLKENNFHITANKIEKTGENTYRIDEATLTTCDGDKPDWKITGNDIKIKEDGSGTAKHATMRVKDIPVLYSPYFYYPANRDRQSGFLMPEFASSDRKGTEYNQPFFWAISDSSDATFYADYMTTRGLKLGAEYRYILSERSQGALMLDGFHDRKVDDGIGDSSEKYGYEDDPVDVLRTNENRFWFRASHHQQLPYDIFAKLDLDIVKDQDYLREFREGYMGYDNTEKYFLKAFHRQLDDYNDPLRVNRLNLNRIWPKFSFNFEPRWNDDTRRDSNTSATLQRLPFIGFDGAKQKILTSPFYLDLESQYNYFWRDEGPRGQRIDVHPRFYVPLRASNYLTIEPSVGLRETAYRLDKENFDDESSSDRWSHRELFDTRLDFFSEISKVFDLEGQGYEKIKHTIRPQVTHEFVPDANQGGLPNFDPIDRIDETNIITYSLTNTLTSKSKQTAVEPAISQQATANPGKLQTPVDYKYTDFFRLKVEQGYDFEKSKRAFAPITARLDIIPGKYIWVDADAAWSIYDNKFLSHNLQASLWDNRGDRLYVDYRYAKKSEEIDNPETIQSLYGKLTVQLTDRLSILAEHEQNIEKSLRIRTGAGFFYQARCWSFDFKYTEMPNDRIFEFKINLLGLGEVGN
jgi:LPS-assembly protein